MTKLFDDFFLIVGSSIFEATFSDKAKQAVKVGLAYYPF